MIEQIERPSNVEAERYVLGACMLSKSALDDVTEILRPQDFHDQRHVTVYAAVRRLFDQDLPTDTVAVTDELMRVGAMIGNLEPAYLYALTSDVATPANAGYHARIVRDASVRRRVMDAAARAAQIASDPKVHDDDVIELARGEFDEVDGTMSRGVEAIGDWYRDYLASLEQKPSYSPTPWYDLNQLIYGFRDGGYYVIAADTGGGKSVVALQCAYELAKTRPVLYVTLEMGREEIAARLAALTGSVFIGTLNKHEPGPTDWEALAAHRSEVEKLQMVVVSSDEVSNIPQLKAKVRATARRFKRNPVVVVDYLQLLGGDGQSESRQLEVQALSRSLKLAAQQWRVPVIVLSQLRRPQQGQKVQEPKVSDLRESGSIANDADAVLLLHRKPVQGKSDEMKVIVGKNRQGQTGTVSLVWQGQFSRALSKYDAREHIVDERGRL